MMMMLLLLVTLVTLCGGERVRYDGCEVWEVTPGSEYQLHQLHTLYEAHSHDDDHTIMFWEEPVRVGRNVEILVCPTGIKIFQQFLAVNQMAAKPISIDLQKNLDLLWSRSDLRHRTSQFAYDDNDYNTYDDIMAQLDVLATNCPQAHECAVETIGLSLEGNAIKAFSISKAGQNREGIWIDSLIHAREWLTGATNMRILSKLVNEYETDDDVRHLVDTYNWYVVPVVNPDGYKFTWTDDRMWRKNRSAGSLCRGTDLNRNYAFMWGTPGASSNQCFGTYHGPTAASEPETQVIQNKVMEIHTELRFFITIHSNAEMYLFPYGTEDGGGNCMISVDHDDLTAVGTAGINAASATNGDVAFETGAICDTLYAASGSSQDWAYATGIKYSFTPELRGPGFDPPNSFIKPSVDETWNGIVAMVTAAEAIEG